MNHDQDSPRWLWDVIEGALRTEESARDGVLREAAGEDSALLYRLRQALEKADIETALTGSEVDRDGSEISHASFAGRTVGGKYELIEEIGRGGMGRVYRARHCQLDQTVAVKILPPGDDLDEALREGRRLAEVDHRAVVQVVDVGAFEDSPYLVMEWLEGFDLGKWLASTEGPEHAGSLESHLASFIGTMSPQHRSFPESYFRFVATVVRDIARAVARVHELGLVHQDIAPKNIVVTEDGSASLVDFGLAASIIETPGGEFRSPHGGTGPYMAPEHRASRAERNLVANDVYGLGATLLHLATGTRPDRLTLTPRTMRRPISFRGHRGRGAIVPRDLLLIGWKATRPDLVERFSDAGQLADELDRFLSFQPLSFTSPGVARQVLLWWKRSPARASVAFLAPAFALLALMLGHSILREVRAASTIESRAFGYERYATLPPYFAIDRKIDLPRSLAPVVHPDTLAALDDAVESFPALGSLRWRRALASAFVGDVEKARADLAILRSATPESSLVPALTSSLTSSDSEARHRLQYPSALPSPACGLDHAILATLYHLARGQVEEPTRSAVHHCERALQANPDDFVTLELLVIKALIGDPHLPGLEGYRSDLISALDGRRTAGELHAFAFRVNDDDYAGTSSDVVEAFWEESLGLCGHQYHARQNLVDLRQRSGELVPMDELIALYEVRIYAARMVEVVMKGFRAHGRHADGTEWLRGVMETWKRVAAPLDELVDSQVAHEAQTARYDFVVRRDSSALARTRVGSRDEDGPGLRSNGVLSQLATGSLSREAALAELKVIREELLALESIWGPQYEERNFVAEALLYAMFDGDDAPSDLNALTPMNQSVARTCARWLQYSDEISSRCQAYLDVVSSND